MAQQIKGWKVYGSKQTDKEKKLGVRKWRPLSRVFNVKQAAEEFGTLARRDLKMNYDEIEVRAEYE